MSENNLAALVEAAIKQHRPEKYGEYWQEFNSKPQLYCRLTYDQYLLAGRAYIVACAFQEGIVQVLEGHRG